jgi:hypothetical protein
MTRSTMFIWRVENPDFPGGGYYVSDLGDEVLQPDEAAWIDGGRVFPWSGNASAAAAHPVPCAGTVDHPSRIPGDGLCEWWSPHSEWLSGFASVAQARAWFRPRHAVHTLSLYGFTLVAVKRTELAEFHIGGHQVIFRCDAPPPRATFPMAYLWDMTAAQLCALALAQLEA